MVKIGITTLFLISSISIFGQFLSTDLEGDSISISVSGNGIKYPLTIISLNDGELGLSYRIFNLETGGVRYSDTTVTNDSLYNELRNEVYYWFFKDNYLSSKSLGKYSERGLVWVKTEIWIGDYDRKKLLASRNYYCVAGKLEYLWSEEFEEFYISLYKLQRALK